MEAITEMEVLQQVLLKRDTEMSKLRAENEALRAERDNFKHSVVAKATLDYAESSQLLRDRIVEVTAERDALQAKLDKGERVEFDSWSSGNYVYFDSKKSNATLILDEGSDD